MFTTTQQPQDLVGVLAVEHREIRVLLKRLDEQLEDRAPLAEELSCCVAKHRNSAMEAVLRLPPFSVQPNEYEHRVQLLLSLTRSVNVLVDRLRLPMRNPHQIEHVMDALRTLTEEHERLEIDLVLAAAVDDPSAMPR